MSYISPAPGGGSGGAVDSVNGFTGTVLLTTDNIPEGAINFYYTGVVHDASLFGSGTVADPLRLIGSTLSNSTVDVKMATTGALPGSPVYANGTGGVGATLTRGTNGTLGTIDGITVANQQVGDRILVKNQAVQLQNGIYEITVVGSASVKYVLTRTSDADQTVELDDLSVVPTLGTINKGVPFGQQTNNPTIGTSNIVFTASGIYVRQQTSGTQVAGQIPYWTGAGLTLSKGDNLFTRDLTTRATTIARTFIETGVTLTSGLYLSVDIANGGASPSTIPGTILSQSGDDGSRALMGVVDFFNLFGGARTTAYINVTDGINAQSQLIVQPDQGAFLFENSATNDSTIMGFSSLNWNAFVNPGSGIGRGFEISANNIGWQVDNSNFRLPGSSLPSVGQVLMVDSVSGNNVGLVFDDAGAGGGVELGGTATMFDPHMIQYISDSGSSQRGSNNFTYDENANGGIFNVTTNYASNVTVPDFSGSGVNDFSTLGAPYTGQTNIEFRVVIEYSNLQKLTYTSLSGPFAPNATVTGSISGATGTLIYDDGSTGWVVITNGIPFATGDIISDGSETANYATTIYYGDIWGWYKDGVLFGTQLEIDPGVATPLSDGITAQFASLSGHDTTDQWIWWGIQPQQTTLTNNQYFFQLPGLSDNYESYVNGAVQINGSQGVQVFNGLWQSLDSGDFKTLPMMYLSQSTTGERYHAGFRPGDNGLVYSISMNNGVGNQTSNGWDALGFMMGGATSHLRFDNVGNAYTIDDSGNTFFKVDLTGRIFGLGDRSGGSGNTWMEIDSTTNRTVTFNSLIFQSQNSGMSFFKLDYDNLKATMGNMAAFGTRFEYVLTADELQAITDNQFNVNDQAGTSFLRVNNAIHFGWIGDKDGAFNAGGTALVVDWADDQTKSIWFKGGMVFMGISTIAHSTTNSVSRHEHQFYITGGTPGTAVFNLDDTYLDGQEFTFSDVDRIGSTSNIVIDAGSGKTIISTLGAAQTFTMSGDGDSLTIRQINSTAWMVI